MRFTASDIFRKQSRLGRRQCFRQEMIARLHEIIFIAIIGNGNRSSRGARRQGRDSRLSSWNTGNFIVQGEQTFKSLKVPMEQWNKRTNRATCDVERGANISYETEGTCTARVDELPAEALPEDAACADDFNATDIWMALTSWP
jgi:hypothetical protein